MGRCFCCEKETPRELLKSDDFVYGKGRRNKKRKFCPTCQQFGFSCHLCNKYYVSAKYLTYYDFPSDDEDDVFADGVLVGEKYIFNEDDDLEYDYDDDDKHYFLKDKERLLNESHVIVPTEEDYTYIRQYVAKCKVCSKIACDSCTTPFSDPSSEYNDFYYCKKCVKNKIPEIISFRSSDINPYDRDVSYYQVCELNEYSFTLMESLIKEREEAKKLKKEIIKYKKENIEYKKEMLKIITPFPETIIETIFSYL